MKSLITIFLLLSLQSCASYVAHQGLALRAAASMQETKVEKSNGKALNCQHNDGELSDWFKGKMSISLGGCYSYKYMVADESSEVEGAFNEAYAGHKLRFLAFNDAIRDINGKLLKGKTCMIFFFNQVEGIKEKKWTYKKFDYIPQIKSYCHIFEE